MNADIVLAAEGKPENVSLGFMAARTFIAAEETRFTRFSPNSELARLNRTAGEWFTASPQMFGLLQQAQALMEETDGLFNPCILDALEAAGYDRSMDEIRAQGAGERGSLREGEKGCTGDREYLAPAHPFSLAPQLPLSPAPPLPGSLAPSLPCQIELDAEKCSVRVAPEARIDLGGIAKGWIAESAARVLAQYCDACAVNAGGDLFAIGTPKEDKSWRVALEDPRDAQNMLAVLRVGPGAVTTSSITKRRWIQNGRSQHHLIDPRTGLPAQTDWLSVTVIAPNATVAEVYAKSLLIAGSREARQIAESRKDIEFIAVDGQGQLWGSDRAKEYITLCTNG